MVPMTSPTLQEQGWTQRFTAIGLRLSEAVDLYRQLGYDVHLEPTSDAEESDESEVCKNCIVTTLARTIYTRPRANRQQELPGKE